MLARAATLPYDYPREDRHASILTEPPGRYTDLPALVLNRYGKGKVIYSSAMLEVGDHDSQREVFYRIIRNLASDHFCVETDAHRSVEITRFDQYENNRTILHVLNYQSELPNIPIYNIKINVKPDNKEAKKIFLIPTMEELGFDLRESYIEFILPELINYKMISIEY